MKTITYISITLISLTAMRLLASDSGTNEAERKVQEAHTAINSDTGFIRNPEDYCDEYRAYAAEYLPKPAKKADNSAKKTDDQDLRKRRLQACKSVKKKLAQHKNVDKQLLKALCITKAMPKNIEKTIFKYLSAPYNIKTLEYSKPMCDALWFKTDAQERIAIPQAGLVSILNANTGERIRIIISENDYALENCTKITSDNKLVVPNYDRTRGNVTRVSILDMSKKYGNLEELSLVTGNSDIITCLEIGKQEPQNSFVICGTDKGIINIWDLSSTRFSAKATFKEHKKCINCLQLMPDNKLVSASDDSSIKVWDLTTFECIATHQTKGKVIAMQALDGMILYLNFNSNVIQVWDFLTDTLTEIARPHNAPDLNVFDSINKILLMPGKRLISASYLGIIEMWDLKTKKYCGKIGKHSAKCRLVPTDNGFMTAGPCSSDIKIWDMNGPGEEEIAYRQAKEEQAALAKNNSKSNCIIQ